MIYDVIKGNESDVGNIDFELQAKRACKFFVLHCLGTSMSYSYLCNQMSDWDGFESKCNVLNGQVDYIEKLKLNIADMWIIPLDLVTFKIVLNLTKNTKKN